MKKAILCAFILVLMAFAFTGCANDGDGGPPAGQADGGAVAPSPAATPDAGAQQPGDAGTAEAPPVEHPLAIMEAVLQTFPQYFDTGAPHVPGSIFEYAIASSSPFIGLFGGSVFWTEAADNTVSSIIGTSSSLFSSTPLLQFGQEGVVNWTYDVGAGTMTLNMQHDVYWHDGVPLTLDDLVFAYELMAHPDYASVGGVRFTAANRNIVGIMDFQAGLVDHIPGFELSNNNRTLTIHFYSFTPDIPYFSIWSAPAPRHIFGDMELTDIPNSDAVRVNPIGWGPFMVEHIVPGEAVHLVRNENFVFGTPYIEQMIIRRVNPDLVPEHMANGDFDFVLFPTLYFADHPNPTNFRYLGSRNNAYTYISFRLGHFDFDNDVNVFDAHREMNDVNLRRAMALALNEAELGEILFNGLQFATGNFMSPLHQGFMDLSVPMFPYNPAEAMRILDEAGFIDIDGDGFRENPAGEQLVINWAVPDQPQVDLIVGFYMQAWADVGLNVQLWQGRVHDRNYLFDVLDFDTDNEEIHIYMASWTAGFNPDPSGRWGHTVWNPSRYTSDEWDAVLARLVSMEAWDTAYLLEAYSAMQWHLYNVVPFFPTRWSIDLTAVNNRVANYDTRPGLPPSQFGWHTVRLSAATPYR